MGAALAGAAIGTALCTAGLLGTSATVGAAAGAGTAATVAGVASGLPVSDNLTHVQLGYVMTTTGVTAATQTSNSYRDNFLNCMTRTIGRAIVDQITAGVVNWINSGFNGQPAFVQNYQQFFTNVADQAAGAYIQGSALSFLCSPFSLQIKIAIAKSYANRNAAASCTLSRVSQNIQGFMNGNFAAGGWAGLLQFTTVPTNNPFGAYAYAQVGLQSAIGSAQANANRNITPGGFINFVKLSGCTNPGDDGNTVNGGLFLSPSQAAGGNYPPGCKGTITTPGKIIESSLETSLGTPARMLEQAGISGSFDAIISALITQLVTKTLYQGLSSLSGQQGYQGNYLTPDQQQAQVQGNAFLQTLQNYARISQQYGEIKQGSVSDVQRTQQQLSNLLNCWENAASSTNISAEKQQQAAAFASTTRAEILLWEQKVVLLNNDITRANSAIALLQNLQTKTLAVTSTAGLAEIINELDQAVAQGAVISEQDVSTAAQDRASLQNELFLRNPQIAQELEQCQAFTTTP